MALSNATVRYQNMAFDAQKLANELRQDRDRLREELVSANSSLAGVVQMSIDYKRKYYDVCRDYQAVEEALITANARLKEAGLPQAEVEDLIPF